MCSDSILTGFLGNILLVIIVVTFGLLKVILLLFSKGFFGNKGFNNVVVVIEGGWLFGPSPFFLNGVMVAVGVILNLILLDFEYGSAGVNVTDGVKFVDLEEIFCKEIVIGTDDVTGLVFFDDFLFPVAGVNVQDPMGFKTGGGGVLFSISLQGCSMLFNQSWMN